MRVSIVIGQMLCGGAEHVIYRLVSSLLEDSFKVKLVVLGEACYSTFPMLNQMDISQYNETKKRGKLGTNISKIYFIRKVVSTYASDIVLSFIDVTNILTIMATRGLNIPVIISERNNPTQTRMSKAWFLLRHLSYPFADSLVVANKGLKEYCIKYHFNKRIDIIPNLMKPIDCPKYKAKKRIIAVGSLTIQKRFDILIEAVAKLKNLDQLQDYAIVLFGEGPLRSQLAHQIASHSLDDQITLMGSSNDIYPEYFQSTIFVLCSDYEGQPNVLLEAMSCGLACVATNCEYGPSEIISNGHNGLLIPTGSVNELAEALGKLISNESLCKTLSLNAEKTIRNDYSSDKVIKKWLKLFSELTEL